MSGLDGPTRVTGPDGGGADAGGDAARQRDEALRRVRALLRELGTGDDEIDRAVDDDVVDLLMVDRLLVPAERRLTQGEVSEETGTPLELIRRLWRALGFLDVEEGERFFTELDVEAVNLFRAMLDLGMVDVESAIQMSRVIGSSMARIAEAEAAPGATPILLASGDSVLDADEFARTSGASMQAMARLLEFVWRRHLQAATRRAMLIRHRYGSEGLSPTLVVGFADMVGYTLLAQHLGEDELASVVARFEGLAHDIVTGLGGRVVKMIGDEAMFVVQDAAVGARIGLALADAYADDELLSDVRVGMAVGPVLLQDGDYYGAVVNLASRIVNIARPGSVLVSDELHDALDLEAPGEFAGRALRPRTLKGIGRVQLWRIGQTGERLAAELTRGQRWDRLGEVLRELDYLRDRGEQLLAAARRGELAEFTRDAATGGPAGAGSGAGEAYGGDAVGAEVEGAVDGGEVPPP